MSAGHRNHERKLSEKERNELLDEALANTKIKARLDRPFKLDASFDMPLLGSSAIGGRNVYLDRHLKGPRALGFDAKPALIRHERLEQALEDELGWPYALAHEVATQWEHRLVKAKGIDPKAYEKALAPFIKHDEHEKITRCPTDLDLRPELAPPVDKELTAHIRDCQNKEKLAQASVSYVGKSPNPRQACGKCAMFVEDTYGGPACTLVKDEIRPEGHCRRFIAGSLTTWK